MNLATATDLTAARQDITHTFHDLSIALENQAAANQAVDDMHVALRLRGWGKIEKLNWDGSWESDDQGGSYYSTYGFNITIGGESYELGHSLTEDFWEEFDGLIENSRGADGTPEAPFDVAVAKLDLLGITDDTEFHELLIAELAGIGHDEVKQFLWLAARLVEEADEEGELEFTP